MTEQTEGDIVTQQWLDRHRIAIPRATGVFQSATAWVKIASGSVVAAGEKDQTVLAWLVDNGTLGSQDVDYGIAYVTCRSAERAYRRQKGFKSSLDLAALSGGGGLSCEQAAQVFCLMRTGLGRENQAVIEYACDTCRGPDGKSNYRPAYRKAFTALARAFDDAARRVREGDVDAPPENIACAPG